MSRPGLATRLTLWHAAAVALVLAVAGVTADRLLARMVAVQVDATLVALAETEVASALDAPGGAIHLHETGTGSALRPSPGRLGKLVQIVSADGRVVGRSAGLGDAPLPASPALLARLGRGAPVLETAPDIGGEAVRVVSLPVEYEGRLRYVVQVGTPLAPARAVLRTARLLMAGTSAALLAAVVATGALLARGALGPVERMVAMAREIGESSLGRRLPHPGTDDALGRLATTLNAMLGRIERGFEAQRRFTADASHELRGPLTRLRTEIEVALRRPRSATEYEAALRSGLEEVVRLSRLVEALLVLAREDAAPRPDGAAARAAVGTVVEAEARRLAPAAGLKGARLDVALAPGLEARLAPDALALVVGNLLDNAVKFSPPGAAVEVRAAAEGGTIRLAVSDRGPGVPPEDAPHVFERFYRGRRGARADAPGAGLGLAIARAVAERHGGTVGVAETPGGGATFTASLPLAAPLAGRS